MSVQKPLCRLCECPTADGAVLARQVDRVKLRRWAMKAMNLTEEDEYLPEEIRRDCLVCYYCIWQAEFADESGDESVAWWPQNMKLGKIARELRRNYYKGNVEQCWVQLEKVKMEKSIGEESEGAESAPGPAQHGAAKISNSQVAKLTPVRPCGRAFQTSKIGVCIVCKYEVPDISKHMWRRHRGHAFKCDVYGCRTFFFTKWDKDQHVKEKHFFL